MSAVAARTPVEAFRHEALMYAGEADFLAGTLTFIRGGLDADEPTLVVESAVKIALLRDGLGRDAGSVYFADMAEVGLNPARIIPAWNDFVTQHAAGGRRLRGIGEPIWKERGPAELVECQRHESLLNVAFEGGTPWWLLCPYDTEKLDPTVIEEARRSHPYIWEGSAQEQSDAYQAAEMAAAHLSAPLSEPPAQLVELAFDTRSLAALRAHASREAGRAGFGTAQTADLLLAVNEVATNSLLHGGGQGRLRMWRDADTLVSEIRDRGHIEHPLAGRERPTADTGPGRGLWLANQLCDLIEIRSYPAGAVVRLHMRRR
jgi:anti-sigma regulatory factor (Ser/Thr protein kinase)